MVLYYIVRRALAIQQADFIVDRRLALLVGLGRMLSSQSRRFLFGFARPLSVSRRGVVM